LNKIFNNKLFQFYFKYKLKLRVMDETDSTTFVLFDKDAATLLKKSCAEILESLVKIYLAEFKRGGELNFKRFLSI